MKNDTKLNKWKLKYTKKFISKLKTKCLLIPIIVICMSITACSSKTDSKINPDENQIKNITNESFTVNKQIYDGKLVSLTCKEICTDGIVFECKNKSDNSIDIMLNIALDGYMQKVWCNADNSTISANETKQIVMNGTLDKVEHELMSINGTVFVNHTGEQEFDICDISLGGQRNEDDIKPGEVMYSTDDLVVEYLGADAQGVIFGVTNNRNKTITFGADSFIINNDDKDYAMTVTSIVGHSRGTYSIDIFSYNENYFSNDLHSFEGVLRSSVDGEGIVDRFPISYTDENSQLSQDDNTSEENSLTNDEIECLNTVLDEIKTTYGNFTTNSVNIATLHNPEVDEIYKQEIYIIEITIDTSVISNTYYLWSDTHAFSALTDYPTLLETADIISQKALSKSDMQEYGMTTGKSHDNIEKHSSNHTQIYLNGVYKNTSTEMSFEFNDNNISITGDSTSLKGTYNLEEGFLKITLKTGDYYSYKYLSTQNGFDLMDEEGSILSFEKQ